MSQRQLSHVGETALWTLVVEYWFSVLEFVRRMINMN